jgi:hypothetical protein
LGASTAASSKFFFDVSEGRLGIGTDSPQAAIDIAGTNSTISNASGDITITPSANLIVSQGNVGMGTSLPQEKLTLASASNFAMEMATPGAPILTCNTTGGTLADGTYYYKIVALDGVGTTVAGTQGSCTITGGAGAGSVSISWSAVTGASSYRIYGRDTGFSQYWTSSSTSYTDTGTVGTTGTPPSVTTAYVNKLTASGNSWLLGGNVGIGTTSPGQKLDVNGNIRSSSQLISTVGTGTAPFSVSSTTMVNNLNADLLDGLHSTSFARIDGRSQVEGATNLAVGWYTIAVNDGSRATARFGIRDITGARHQDVTFYASHHFGGHSELTIIQSGRYSGTPLRYIRIKEGGTYDGALLQVYIDDATNNVEAYLLGDNFQATGWVIKDWVPDGTDPGGVNNFSALTNEAIRLDIDLTIDGGIATTGPLNIPDRGTSAGSPLIYVGDDSYLTDVDQGNTLGIYSQTDSSVGSIKLGSGGGTISGYNGNVGIGTAGPKERLQIGDGATFHDGGDKALSWNAYYDAGWKFITTDKYATQVYHSSGGGTINLKTSTGTGTAGGGITWNTGLILNSSGDVGIGTTGPSGKLEIAENGVLSATDGNLVIQHPTSGSYSSIVFPSRVNYTSDYGFVTYYDDNNSYAYWGDSNENSALVIGTQNDSTTAYSDVVVLKGSAANVFHSGVNYFTGRVGIGRSPQSATKLDVLTGPDAFTGPGEEWAAQFIQTYNSENGNGVFIANRWRATDSMALQVGSIWWDWPTNCVSLMYVNGNGGGYIRGGWSSGSDRRLKEHIEYFDSGLDEVLELKPVYFDFIMGEKDQIGFIAQDVRGIIPEAVSVEEDGYLSLRQDFVVPFLVNAVKEQNNLINDLDSRVLTMENEVDNSEIVQYNDLLSSMDNLMEYTEDKQLLTIKSTLETENNKYDLGTTENRWKNIYSQESIQIGKEGNSGSIKYDTETNSIQFSNDGINWISLGEATKTITLSAEYEGAVLVGDGSENRGIMTSDSEGTESKYMNYYKWTSNQPVLQDYDVRVRFTLPSDFESWSNNAIKVSYSTETTNKEISKLDLYLFEQNSETVDTQNIDLISDEPGEWIKTTINSENIKQCTKAGDTCILVIRGYSSDNHYVKVGDIELTYRRKL